MKTQKATPEQIQDAAQDRAAQLVKDTPSLSMAEALVMSLESVTAEQRATDEESLDWGIHPYDGKKLSAEYWGNDFAEWVADYYLNHIIVPAAKARSNGKPDAELEASRDNLSFLFAYPDEPARFDWTLPEMEELWSVYLDRLPTGFRSVWKESGRTFADVAQAFELQNPQE